MKEELDITKIIDIRGTHGSGKSHLVHQLLYNRPSQSVIRDSNPITGEASELIGTYLPEFKTAILGKYLSNCGGCDQIKTADEICQRVRDFAEMEMVNTVILEGILVAHTFQRYNDLAIELEEAGHEYVFCFLNVDMETCKRRVEDRREASGKPREFDYENHLVPDWRLIHQRVRQKMLDAGRNVVDWDASDGGDAYESLLEMVS